MSTLPNPPLPAELPVGVGAAFLVMAGVCTLAPLQDRLILIGFFAVVGVLLVAIGFVMTKRRQSQAAQDVLEASLQGEVGAAVVALQFGEMGLHASDQAREDGGRRRGCCAEIAVDDRSVNARDSPPLGVF